MMCQRIGRPPISIIGFGMRCVASPIRTPKPPQKITTFTDLPPGCYIVDRSSAASVLKSTTERERCHQRRHRTRLEQRGGGDRDDELRAPLRRVGELR